MWIVSSKNEFPILENGGLDTNFVWFGAVIAEIFHDVLSPLVAHLSKKNEQNCTYFGFLSTNFTNFFFDMFRKSRDICWIEVLCYLFNTALSSGEKHEKMVSDGLKNGHLGGSNLVQSSPNFAIIIFEANLTTKKKVGVIGESWGEMMHPNR